MKRLTILIVALIVTWLTVVLGKADIESRFSAWSLHSANRASGKPDNPLYRDMQATAQKLGVDVSFIRTATRTRELSLTNAEIFTKRPGYYDVIVFGDSSLIWSFSPQLVSQVSGKKVAFLGGEAAVPTRTFIPFAEQISDVYLKKGGLAVFLFLHWTSDPSEGQHTGDMIRLTRDSDSSVWRRELERAADSIFALPRLAVYGDAVEPFYAPERYKEKHFFAQGMGCTFYSWGPRSVAFFLHCRGDNGEASPTIAYPINLAGTIVKQCSGGGDDTNTNAELNLGALANAKIPTKVIAVPFFHAASPVVVCETRALKDKLYLLDLPRLAVEKYGITSLEFQWGTHLANTSSIPASVVLGRALRDFHP